MSSQPTEEKPLADEIIEKKEEITGKEEEVEQSPPETKKETVEAMDEGNWGDFADSAIAKPFVNLVQFAENVTEIPVIRTEEFGAAGGNDGGWERHQGRRGFDRDDNNFRHGDRDRRFDRRNDRDDDNSRKRRGYDEGGRRGVAYEGRYEKRDGDRYNDRREDRYGDRRDGDRREFGGRWDYGQRNFRDDDRRSFDRREPADRNFRGDDRWGGDADRKDFRRDGPPDRDRDRRDSRKDNNDRDSGDRRDFRREGGDRFRSYDRDRGDSRGGGFHSNRPPPLPSKVVGIFGLPTSVAHEELTEFLKFQIPNVSYQNIHLVKDRQTGSSRGFAFVYFDSVEDATQAKEALMDCEIQNRRLRVDFAMNEGPRTQKY